jgi:hypothetical protein
VRDGGSLNRTMEVEGKRSRWILDVEFKREKLVPLYLL